MEALTRRAGPQDRLFAEVKAAFMAFDFKRCVGIAGRQFQIHMDKEYRMEELLKKIMEITGADDETARKVVDEVVAYTKSKVPGPFQHFVDQIFERDE